MTGREAQLERYQRDITATEERAEMLRGLIDDLVQDIPSRGDEEDEENGDDESA
jgi:hypothetical protein